jgi:hypothetical protein
MGVSFQFHSREPGNTLDNPFLRTFEAVAVFRHIFSFILKQVPTGSRVCGNRIHIGFRVPENGTRDGAAIDPDPGISSVLGNPKPDVGSVL